jgi:hypothetical protein
LNFLLLRYVPGIENPSILENPDLAEPCFGNPADLFSAAEIMHMRLQRVFAGQHSAVAGFSFASPTEYLGMVGLAEAVLYTLRMYEAVLHSVISVAPPEREEDLVTHMKLNKDRIEFVLAVVGAGYESDKLMRSLPAWMDLVADSALSARTAVALLYGVPADEYNYCDATRTSPQLRELVPYFLGDEAGQDDSEGAAVAPLHTLNNGVQMPVMGLGTWQLQGQACQDAVLAAISAGYR